MKEPLWLRAARKYAGQKEIPGPKSNPVYLGWAARVGGWIRSWYTSDDLPSCALFVNACLAEAGQKGTNSLASRSFDGYGAALQQPVIGAILRFWRKSRGSGLGHVGFYVGETTTKYRVFGANQGNTVCETWIAKDRIVAIRWPGTMWQNIGEYKPVFLKDDGTPVSINEA